MSTVIIGGGDDAKARINKIIDMSERMSTETLQQAQALIDGINDDLHQFLGSNDPVS